jgi:hypothetical protein
MIMALPYLQVPIHRGGGGGGNRNDMRDKNN